MAREYPTLLELVGHTPLVRLQNVVPDGAATLLAKLEYLNPGGSVKDRIAITMVDAAEREGKLKPGGTIVGADPEGSIYTSGPEKQHPYLVEGIGEDFYPETFDPSVVDDELARLVADA